MLRSRKPTGERERRSQSPEAPRSPRQPALGLAKPIKQGARGDGKFLKMLHFRGAEAPQSYYLS